MAGEGEAPGSGLALRKSSGLFLFQFGHLCPALQYFPDFLLSIGKKAAYGDSTAPSMSCTGSLHFYAHGF